MKHDAPFYHDGMRDLQDRYDGRRVADGLEKNRLHFEFWEQDRNLIEGASFFFIATSYQDMADTLSLPEKTVKSRLYSARQLLRDILAQEGAI